MIGFHLASRRRANIGLMADDVRSTTQPLPVKIAIMEIWYGCAGVAGGVLERARAVEAEWLRRTERALGFLLLKCVGPFRLM
ncbi:hypothetical protein ES332_A03G143800v1 [Gossypium tomentosum]|uniref:Uncharacterized protein n=1 Tax=Gossypium tomentosum TaxID=34277 RepID=A0A5D2R823_GOSTO|nr:hypothetical protein ES332_A03G143800v1 [Gossypium tomentosum]